MNLDKTFTLLRNSYNRLKTIIDKNNTLFWVVAVLMSFSAILILNLLTPLISDDFAYMFVYGENRLATSITDIYESQLNHYYQWGGRSIVHFIAQILLLLPSYVADLLNTLMFVVYVFLIYYHIKGRDTHSLSLFILINIAIWFFQPVLGDTIFWLTGSANYLWGTAFILLYLLPFRLYEGNNENPLKKVLISIGMLLLGLVAGWTNENTAGAMLLISVLFLLYYRSQKWLIPIWSIIALIGAIAGFIVMIVAPGNFVRAGASSYDLFIFVYRLFNCTQTVLFYCSSLIIVTLLMYVIYYNYSNDNKRSVGLSLIYTIAAVAAVYAMILSPTFPRRALFGVVTYLIIGAGILFYNLDCKNNFIRQSKVLIIAFSTVCFFFSFYFAYKEINTYRIAVEQRSNIIKKAKEDGQSECEFQRFSGGIYIHGEDPFSEELMSRYYGIKITLTTSDN